ncbi:hypothetical protein [Bacillus sp. ISL-7]|uniref:hypothetical protein n=1 Tax=Bacillus sp. ISL-7 TaxID=2819136 RepID=UPI001BE8739C|nr:hypothetical protein [Bacillus sp. ISL-7]MBT2737501.1 hypothetical protein [Bacillus sp. ISL-7]
MSRQGKFVVEVPADLKQSQIIFFSHHSRLIELMREVTTESSYQLTELNTVSV